MVLEASCARLDRLDSWKRNTATVKHWLCREANVDDRAKEMAEDQKKKKKKVTEIREEISSGCS